ncbi:MATE family efflux transporter [Desulfobacter sp.]|uniref:MATE family efflux transporter n=1 Tax=Desulfobacter sp. TaxID=2294 RepID=UPI003D09640E
MTNRKQERRNKIITTDREGPVILKLAGPMVFSMLGLILFNLVDTFFVGRLGSVELAAVSFTFPVVMVLGSIAHGLNSGITASVSRAVGKGDLQQTAALVTRGLILALMMVAVFAGIGLGTMEMVFTWLGADDATLPVIKAYMRIWYPGAVFFVVPAAAHAALFGLGDTRTPSAITLVTALLNAVLDPFLIFGIGPFPALGVSGAAVATVIARGAGFVYLLGLPAIKKNIFTIGQHHPDPIYKDWARILQVGGPGIAIKLTAPGFSGMITRMVADFGSSAVAGFGIALRLEMLFIVPITAVVQVMPVFIGQNLGAGKKTRMQRGVSFANHFFLVCGAVVYLFVVTVAGPAARLINPAPDIVQVTVLYMTVAPVAYGFYAMMQMAVSILNVLKRPMLSTGIVLAQIFAVFLPLALWGGRCFGLAGIFGALAVSWAITGFFGAWLTRASIT